MTFKDSHQEAILAGCYPVVPNDLVYPEYVPEHFRFDTENSEEKVGKNAAQLISSFLLLLPGTNCPIWSYSYNSVQKRYLDWVYPYRPDFGWKPFHIGLNLVNFLFVRALQVETEHYLNYICPQQVST